MERRTGMAGFVAVTVLLVLVAAFCCVGTVMSRSNVEGRELEGYYLAREQELKEDIREFLQQAGFENSGVMVTRVVEADGSRLYTVTVHHGRISVMSPEDRDALLEQLEEISFADENCSFVHEFLLDE